MRISASAKLDLFLFRCVRRLMGPFHKLSEEPAAKRALAGFAVIRTNGVPSMSAARTWSNPASYAAFRATAWAKRLARSVIDTGVAIVPGPASRLAAYVQSLERGRALRAQKETIERSEKPLANFDDLLGKASASLDHRAILELRKAAGELTEAGYHRYLTTAFNARRPDRVEQTIAGSGYGFPDTELFHGLRLQQYRGEITATPADIVAAYRTLSKTRLHRDYAANLAADMLARLGNAADLTAFLECLPPEDLTRLAAPTFFGCLRLMAGGGESSARISWLRRAYLEALPIEKQLYFLEMLPARDQVRVVGAAATPVSALEAFRSAYSAQDDQDKENFERCVVAPLKQLPAGPGNLMNIRFSATERDALVSRFAAALKSGQGLGLVRLGDGEAYGYSHDGLDIAPSAAFEEDNATRERMWWGRTLPEPMRAPLKQRFRLAVTEADVLGIPSVYRMIRDRGPAGSPFGLTGGQRGLAVVLAKLGTDIPLKERVLTEERCHQILFNRAAIEALGRDARRVVLVSCWRADQIALQAPVPVHEIVIPAHTKVAKATGQEAGAPALFETFEVQLAAMAQLCGPGTLVLVGAGFLGKIFIAAARAKGAVALDVGAVLDYMAGYKTRSLADLG
jgi:hypothetical protein